MMDESAFFTRADDSDIERDFTDAMRCKNRDVLYRIVKRSKRSVALFKEFCARQNWGGVGYSTEDIEWICETFKEKGDVSMALQVAISCNQEMFITACVADSTIGKKERLARLHKLCFIASRRKMAASVEDMIVYTAEELIIQSACKRRTLFLMVVRYGLFHASTEVYRRNVELLKVSDLKFAIRLALASGKNPHLRSLCELAGRQHSDMLFSFTVRNALEELMQDCSSKVKLKRFLYVYKAYCRRRNTSHAFLVSMLRKAVKAAAKTNSLILFVTTCDGFLKCDCGKLDECVMIIQRAFEIIIKNKQYDMAFCAAKQVGSKYKILWRLKILTISIQAAFEQKAWTLLHRLVQEATPRNSGNMACRLDEYELFLACAKKSLGQAEVMKGDGAAALEAWLKTMHAEDEESGGALSAFVRISWVNFLGSLRLNQDESLPAWCHDNACPYLALALALGQENWNLLESVVSQHHGSFTPLLLLGLFRSLFDHYGLNTVGSLAITFLRHVPIDRETLRSEEFSVSPEANFQQLMSALKEAKEYGWVVVFSMNNGHWSDLHKMMSKCKDEAIVDYVIERAADIWRWHMVEKFLPKCCNPAVLYKFLKSAVTFGIVSIVRSVTNLVDLSSPDMANALFNSTSSLSTEASSDMVAQCLVNAGLSTTQRCREKPDGEASNCPLVQAYRRGKVQSVKLFHRSGLCSNRRLFAINWDAVVDEGVRPEILAGRSEIREYMKHAACTPLSLQDLCRQSVSHSVGCRPGRQERIQALPVPQSKLFLRFPEAEFTTQSVPDYFETLQESSRVYLSLDSD